ncbi:hypothetical protein DPX16_0818 [Anabarilius grahami]|uniref:Uncharacterized protein n=1 Tax=Anabarilius grahami TaxID=495550 RepID=A0A3N0XUS4_ANAGA|nr:hypothetical protein DPX16_0818 [Anabarilius grahami]
MTKAHRIRKQRTHGSLATRRSRLELQEPRPWLGERFITPPELLERLRSRVQQALSRQPVDLDFLEFVCNNELILIQSFADQIHIGTDILQQLNHLLELVQAAVENNPAVSHLDTAVGLRGGPRLIIQRDQLHYLLQAQFSVPCIAQLLGVSQRNIFRRTEEYGLSVTGCYSIMTDSELDNMVRAIKTQVPNAGYRNVKGQLMAMGNRVQWERIKASMHRVDAAGVLSRLAQLGCIVRRSYSVRGPLALVHVDTNHKLIRYVFMYFKLTLSLLRCYVNQWF